MEFKAIIDAKARHDAGCAVVGVYEDGDLGTAARRIDTQLNGLIRKLQGDGDFSAKLGDVLLLPSPPGAASARVLLIGLGSRSGFGRKQYRKALQSTVQALGKTGGDFYLVVYTWRDGARHIITAWKVGEDGKRRYEALFAQRPRRDEGER